MNIATMINTIPIDIFSFFTLNLLVNFATVMGTFALLGHVINNEVDYLTLSVMGSTAMIGGYMVAAARFVPTATFGSIFNMEIIDGKRMLPSTSLQDLQESLLQNQ